MSPLFASPAVVFVSVLFWCFLFCVMLDLSLLSYSPSLSCLPLALKGSLWILWVAVVNTTEGKHISVNCICASLRLSLLKLNLHNAK